MRKSIHEFMLAATNRAFEESGINNFNAEMKNRFDSVIVNELDRVTEFGREPFSVVPQQPAILRGHYFNDSVKVLDSIHQAAMTFESHLAIEQKPAIRKITHGVLKDFENLTLLSFISQRALYKDGTMVYFALMLPNIHGLIKLLMHSSDDRVLRQNLYAQLNRYQSFQQYQAFHYLKYDPMHNYWSVDSPYDRDDAIDDLVEFILSEV